MSTSLQEQLGVALSGQSWDVGGYRLWQSNDPAILLFRPIRPRLVKDEQTGRYQVVINQFQQWQAGVYQVVGGSVMFTLTTALQATLQELQQLKEQWTAAIRSKGYTASQNPKFIPLPMQNRTLQVALDPAIGKVSETGGSEPGTDGAEAGETLTLLIELTAQGAQAWSRSIKTQSPLSGGVKISYQYPQLLPKIEGRVTVHGWRVYSFLTRTLTRSDDGSVYYGSASEIDQAWRQMVAEGDIEIKLTGAFPAELQSNLEEMLATFADQAKQQLFDTLFSPLPDPPSSPSGNNWGFNTGGMNNGGTTGSTESQYALRWRKRADAVDLSLTLKFEAWNWLAASIEADFSTLFQPLDERYLSTIFTDAAIPVSLIVEPHPMVTNVSVSLIFSQGHIPEAPLFGKEGGAAQYTIISNHPDLVTVQYQAKVNFSPSNWPIIETGGSFSLAQGTEIRLKPGQWVRRHEIYLYLREGNAITPAATLGKNDFLTLNILYAGPHLKTPIRESIRLTGTEIVEFRYPLDPAGRHGQAKVSALGFIGGRPVQVKEVTIDPDENALYVLASLNGQIQLIAKRSPVAESDALAMRLIESGARPVLERR